MKKYTKKYLKSAYVTLGYCHMYGIVSNLSVISVPDCPHSEAISKSLQSIINSKKNFKLNRNLASCLQ